MGLILDGTTGISASGNIYGANIIVTNNFTPAAISVVGNVQGDYIKGNGSLLTGIDATSIQNGTSNVRALASANVTIGVAGTANVAVFATTGEYVTGVISASGNITGGNLSGTLVTGTLTTAAQPNITSVGTLSSLSVTANVTGGNVTTGIVSATGSITTTNGVTATGNITGGNISGTNLSGSLTTAAQANITSVGTLTSLSVTGNINGGNITTVGTASIAGFTIGGNTITAQGPTLTIDPNASGGIDGEVVIQGNLVVNGNMTYINSNNITTNDLTINMANNAATATAANGGGIEVGPAGAAYISLTYNSASNIWVASNGMSVQGVVQTAGNISGGNLLTGGQLSATGNITGGNISTTTINVATGGSSIKVGNPFATNGVIYVYGSSGFNDIILDGTDASINADGNITGANILTAGRVSATGNITGGNVLYGSGQISGTGSMYATAFVGSLTGTASVAVSASGTAATVTTAAQPNITSVGTLSSLTVTANISGGNLLFGSGVVSGTGAITGGALTGSSLTVSTGNITGGNIVNANANGVGNIGSATTYFNTVFAKATSAQYADLAEKYTADADYAPGTVVSFGGSAEVTQSTVSGDRRVAGVVSTDPAYIMNSGLTGTVATVALTGRVPTSVTGQVRKGDLMVSNGDGSARAEADPQVGSVIGKALENFDGETGTIEVVIGRL